ncbi:alpha/beta hydrolase family protein [Spirosoma aerophilum]
MNSLYAQYTPRAVGGYTVFTIPFEGDSVTFAVVAKPGQLKARKPVFLFRQGSLPIPLFTINPKNNRPSLTELPITCYDHEGDYYSIMIAKPGVPLVVKDAYLDTLFTTRNNPKPSMYPPNYQAHNYLDYYVRQTNEVLKFVLKQPWADAKQVAIVGGSEGYYVAIKTAFTNPKVTHLIAFSGFLDGRQQGLIRQERAKGISGEISQEDAQRNIEALQQQWVEICKDSLNTSANVGDPPRTTYSFSHNQTKDQLLSLSVPILIMYGTADIAATSNDILPLEFALHGKRNLSVKAYPNHDHKFHKLTFDSRGKVANKIYNGIRVEQDYFQWLKEH